MILIYAPFPHARLVRDGWMRRIATIERIFADRERAYVYPGDPAAAADWRDYRVNTEIVAPAASFTYLDFRFAHHHRHLAELVAQAEFVYAHTSHSAQHLLPFYSTGKIVTDLHGIAPEEETLQGRSGRASFFGGLEETMVRESAALVSVTAAMGEHLHRKYPGCDTPVIRLPIVEDFAVAVDAARPARARPVVVYVGGLQQWQKVDAMLRTVAACRGRYDFRFYTDAPDALRASARAAGVDGDIRIGTAAPTELANIYREADFGFVLRDDIAVNRVSCPTKLSEYLALGVVPIVELEEIGDFAQLGYRRIRVADLVTGALPDSSELLAMRRANVEVFRRIQATFTDGERRLRELRIKPSGKQPADSIQMSTLERTYVYPLRGASLAIRREDGEHRVTLDDIVAPRLQMEIQLPGRGRLLGLAFVPGDAPLVTSPWSARLRFADGSDASLPLAGDHVVDRFGNWRFDAHGAALRASTTSDAAPSSLMLKGEYLLFGAEALVAGAHPKAGLRQRLMTVAAHVPGARQLWRLVRRATHD